MWPTCRARRPLPIAPLQRCHAAFSHMCSTAGVAGPTQRTQGPIAESLRPRHDSCTPTARSAGPWSAPHPLGPAHSEAQESSLKLPREHVTPRREGALAAGLLRRMHAYTYNAHFIQLGLAADAPSSRGLCANSPPTVPRAALARCRARTFAGPRRTAPRRCPRGMVPPWART